MRLICGAVLAWALACLGGCAAQEAVDLSAAMARYEARFAGGRTNEMPAARRARGVATFSGHGGTGGPAGPDSRLPNPRAHPSIPIGTSATGIEVFCNSHGRAGAPDEPDAVDPDDMPWRRSGPAYPGRFWSSLGHDIVEWPVTMVDDVKATATNGISWILFAAAGAGGAALANSDADDKVNDHYEKHGAQLGSLADDVGEVSGSAALHFSIAGTAYLTALAFEDEHTYRASRTMINALALTGVTTLGLKAAVNTKRPNGDRGGWPSGHASGSFCFATVIYHEYGPWAGVGAYAVATFSAYQRVDSQYHHLSDVVSGAFIGVAFGHAVAGNHKPEVLGMDVVPYVDPHSGAVGLALTKQW